VKTQHVSILIGLIISCFFSFESYKYIEHKNQNLYIQSDSKIFNAIETVQNRYDDLKLISQPYRQTKARTALIAIDNSSIEELGRWPWSRETVSEITSELLKFGVTSVAFDMAFSEPERENILADKKFGQLIEKNPEQIILGTAGSGQVFVMSPPYQDICRYEAFLHFGGNQLIKPNLTFNIKDETDSFTSYDWPYLFSHIFSKIESNTKEKYLAQQRLTEKSALTQFQKNALQTKMIRDVNSYCDIWLTANDPYLHGEKSQALLNLNLYSETLKRELSDADLKNEIEKIKKIKAHPVQQFTDWLINIPELQQPAYYTASFNAALDSSGLIRYYYLFNRIGFKIGDSYIPSIAMQMYLLSEKKRAEILFSDSTTTNEKKIQKFFLQDADDDKKPIDDLKADHFARIRLNYLGETNSFYYVSAKDLLQKSEKMIEVQIRNSKNEIVAEKFNKSDFFKNRSVLVGASALGIGDIRNTPVQIGMPGPETHLNAYANLIDKNYILDVENSLVLIPVLTFACGLIFTIIFTFASPLVSPLIFMSIFIVGYYLDFALFLKYKMMTTTWALYGVLLFSFIIILLYKYFTEERSKKKIRQAFSKYVSPAVVNELLKSEKNLELGGKKQRLTVMFSDLRGFTTFSEKLDPQQLSDFLNIYFTKMTDEVFKANGTLDKFIGDAVMAFFGAPLTYDNNAANACRCALQSLERLSELNTEFQKQGYPHLEMGIGINTGDMSVGNMGSATLQNYTVLGDSVNLAARLEGLNKDYGTKIIIGEDTYLEVKNQFTCRQLDLVRVKGKKTATPIYELIGTLDAFNDLQTWLSEYQSARADYQNKNFISAQIKFQKCIDLKSSDKTSQIFLDRCTQYIQNPPDTNWDGAYNLDHK
jgi:adenylate cyclase